MDREAVFVDTWGWMALGHRREPRHAEVNHPPASWGAFPAE